MAQSTPTHAQALFRRLALCLVAGVSAGSSFLISTFFLLEPGLVPLGLPVTHDWWGRLVLTAVLPAAASWWIARSFGSPSNGQLALRDWLEAGAAMAVSIFASGLLLLSLDGVLPCVPTGFLSCWGGSHPAESSLLPWAALALGFLAVGLYRWKAESVLPRRALALAAAAGLLCFAAAYGHGVVGWFPPDHRISTTVDVATPEQPLSLREVVQATGQAPTGPHHYEFAYASRVGLLYASFEIQPDGAGLLRGIRGADPSRGPSLEIRERQLDARQTQRWIRRIERAMDGLPWEEGTFDHASLDGSEWLFVAVRDAFGDNERREISIHNPMSARRDAESLAAGSRLVRLNLSLFGAAGMTVCRSCLF